MLHAAVCNFENFWALYPKTVVNKRMASRIREESRRDGMRTEGKGRRDERRGESGGNDEKLCPLFQNHPGTTDYNPSSLTANSQGFLRFTSN
jgi:hypothetical protein